MADQSKGRHGNSWSKQGGKVTFSLPVYFWLTFRVDHQEMKPDREAPVPGGTYFFTVCLQDRTSTLLVDHVELVWDAVRQCRQKQPFRIEAAVILPSRLHMIWQLPPMDADYAQRWRTIKTTFARQLPDSVRAGLGGARLWQRRFWEQRVAAPSFHRDFVRLMTQAPVQAGLVRDAADWPHKAIPGQKLDLVG